ncbi:MAG: tryptophan--tRNA ligase [Candidatus Diapherotrites archaeon]|nr:tryptophan--tRNA ligase [Candidatus Diapherotrites archaeon]
MLNPWETTDIKDYNKLIEEFGITPMKPTKELMDNRYFRRGIIFGHRDFFKFWNADKRSILTGIMPSGPMHLGHKMVVDQCVYYQNKGIKTRIAIADVEAITTRRIPEEKAREYAVEEYLLNWVALGLDLDKADVYAQTNRSVPYYRLASLLSGRTTMAEMQAIYGELTPGKVTSIFIQASDILHPQLDEYDGLEHVLVPVGVDQDPHIRFVRDLAEKIHFIKPSSTYHRFMTGLEGGKMSSSVPNSYLALNDDLPTALKKASNVLTGGRNTAEEQRRLGGDISKCVVYELYAYHFIEDDDELKKIYEDCTSGKMLCGECKQILKKKVEEFMTDLKNKREANREKVEQFAKEKLFK